MGRRRAGELVENEERVGVAALRIDNHDTRGGRFWVRDVQEVLAAIDPSAHMNDSTVNRVLNRLVDQGWMSATWETANPDNHLSSKPRLYFRLTDIGRNEIREFVSAKRRNLPPWLLDPKRTLGEDPARLDLPRTSPIAAAAGRPRGERKSLRSTQRREPAPADTGDGRPAKRAELA